ncbi:hypothetical protein ASC80_21620 [Afipia sp. Root123D2]|nr:hypothetical protein ASC80_21620 [Afipia sp. Root123D2]
MTATGGGQERSQKDSTSAWFLDQTVQRFDPTEDYSVLLTRASCGAATNSSAIEQFCEWFWMKTALVATELAFDVNRPSGPGGSELRNMGGLHEGHVSVAASARLQSMRSRSHRRDL